MSVGRERKKGNVNNPKGMRFVSQSQPGVKVQTSRQTALVTYTPEV